MVSAQPFGLAIVVAGIAAVIYAILPVGSQTYCYTSITTLSESVPKAKCFVVSKEGIFSKISADDSTTEAKSKINGHVLPGLWDGHGHLLQYGEMLHSVNLFGAKSMEECQRRITTYTLEHPDEGTKEEWIRGIGWDQAVFGRMPTAADLDFADNVRGKFIMLDRVDVHCIWVSQAVLDLMPDPIPSIPGGEVIYKPGMGVFCDNAMTFVRQYWPPRKDLKKRQFLKTAAKDLNSLGIVGMHDAGSPPEDIEVLRDMVGRDDWSLRVYGMFECEQRNTFCPEQALKISQKDGFLTVRSVKLFADGALGSWGSALIEPYQDRPETSGSLLINASQLSTVAKQWASLGYQVNIHAIGDLANRLSLDALTGALKANCPNKSLSACQAERRFRIEHSQIVHPDDQERFHKVGIIPSIQPTHATSDMSYALDRLGETRTETEAYRMRSFLPLNPILGSDFPVEPPDPWQGIYAATTRKSPHTGKGKGGSSKGWHTEEALSLDEALRGFTLGPAHGAFLEDKAGVIKEGAFADWVVLDTPIDQIQSEDLIRLRVKETWIAGKRIYKRAD